MKIKQKRSKFQSDLLHANNEIERLTAESKTQQTQIGQLVNFLTAVLMTHHKGFVDIKPEDLRRTQGMAVNTRQLSALGFIRISAFMPGADKIAVPDGSDSALHTGEEAEAPSPLNCSDSWHVDPNAMGVLCPECGSKTRLETAPVAAAVV